MLKVEELNASLDDGVDQEIGANPAMIKSHSKLAEANGVRHGDSSRGGPRRSGHQEYE